MTARHLLIVVLISAGAHAAEAQDALQNRTPNTFTAGPEVPSPRATVHDLAWLAGRWRGAGLGGVCEEAWSAPSGGAMMGMFRLIKDGKVVFYEFLTFAEHEGSLLLKLKHFNPDLTGWDEKADVVKFRLLKTSRDTIHFDGLTFKRGGNDRLEIFLAIRNRTDGSVREERFEMIRTPSPSL